MAIPEHVRAELDLERVTLAGAERFIGSLSPSTIDSYVPMWRFARRWCRPPLHGREAPERWYDFLPMATDTLTELVDTLCQLGWAPSTIRRARSAVIAWHRLHGVPVPDGYGASQKLSEYQTTLRDRGWRPRRAEALPLDDVLVILAACPLGEAKGHRDAVLLLLAYAAGLRPERLSGLRLNELGRRPDGTALRIAGADGLAAVYLEHWAVGPDGTHYPDRCPIEIIEGWARRLYAGGASGGDPVIRAVDKAGHIAGVDDTWSGHAQPRAGGIHKRGLGYALAGMLTRAGVADPGRFQWESLVLGGRTDRRLHGATVLELAEATGLRPDSASLLDVVRIAEAIEQGGEEDR